MSKQTAREALIESLMVERFTTYRPTPEHAPTAEEVARAIRLVIDNTQPERNAS